jgi:molybdate transport system regulatory protein
MRNKKTNLTEALGHQASDKRLDILRRIGENGSISEAARSAGVSYKAAWQAIETLSNLAGTALVEKVVGGAGGGGARLTPAGRQLLRASAQMQAARKALLQTLDGDGAQAQGLAALNLRTSMRNQLPCTIKALKKQGASIRVELALADGTCLLSRITRESAELLELQVGQSVLALCKATAVDIKPANGAVAGNNVLAGAVSRATPRDQEVALRLAGGLQLVGFAGGSHGFKPGTAAVAVLDEAAVVIAVTP